MQKQITVFEIRLKVFLLKDIPLSKMLTAEAYFIDSVLTKDQEWLTYHETNQYKLYCMNGLFPLERDGIYKKEQIYTITIRTVEAELARYFAKELSNIAKENHIKIGSCAEKIDLDEYGIIHNSCIDKELIEKIIGCKLKINKDKNQRIECGCVESVEVGTYNTCKNGCVYCYANYSAKSVESNFQKYDPLSPLLCGHIEKDDKISTRKVVSLKETQISIFDI